jgi:trk system potassium uptake protein TrkA
MYVFVVGAGKIGYYLTRTLLDEGHEVVLVERDRATAQRLAGELGEVAVHGDGCEVRTMEELGMGRAACVVAVTGHDEDNLVICQMAKQRFKVPRTIARVNNPRNEEVFRDLGIDATVSGTRIIYSLLEQEVETGDVVFLSALKRGKIELVMAELVPSSPAVGKLLKDIHLPGECVVAALIREEHIVLPSGTTELEAGDTVIALSHPEEERNLREALVGAG